jgi:Mn2+/Fe2+ NRAMP family transporter
LDDVRKEEMGKAEDIEKVINSQNQSVSRKKSHHWLKSLGPGVITGAAEVDPATIGTYSQAGAQFGFGVLRLALSQYPMIAIVQEMCTRIGLLTGNGLTTVIKIKYSSKVALPLALFSLQIP